MPRRRTSAHAELSGARRVVVLAVAFLLLLGGGVAALVDSVPHLGYAARLQGTPGVLTVVGCEDTGTGRERRRECVGIFRSDDGRSDDPDAHIGDSLAVGRTVPVQRTHAGGYVRVGFAAFCGWLSVAFLGVLLAGLVVMTGVSLALATPARGGWLTLGAVLAAALACALISAIGSALA
ncbi:hypothetical protein [Streptomyces sp. NPDC020917]|uniref:hypothetical protein n=1 Tax=Streptomyces sp. NPDC020917 TaxID=3365102 RepID=UPI00378B4143